MSRVFVTGGSGVIGGALVERLVARGDDVVALARSDEAAAALQGRGAEVARGDVLDEAALVRGMEGAELAFHVAGINAFCVEDPEPMRRVNVDGAVAAVRAAAAAGVPRLVHTSSAATLGEAPGTVGREDTPHRGWYLSTYERTKTEGERAVLAAAAQTGQDVVCVNPSSVQGPGRAGGTGRFLLAFLDGRMKVFVQTNVSLVDIADCVEGHLLAAERGQAGERYLLNGMTLTLTEALALAAEVAGVQRTPRLLPRPVATVAAGVAERGFRLARRHPAGVPRDGPHAAARPPLRRLARRARARPALHRPGRDRAAHGRLGAVGRAAEERLGRRLPRRRRRRRAGRASAARARRRARPGSPGSRPPWPPWPCSGPRSSASSRNWSASSGVAFSTSSRLTARSSSRISSPAFLPLGLNPPSGLWRCWAFSATSAATAWTNSP